MENTNKGNAEAGMKVNRVATVIALAVGFGAGALMERVGAIGTTVVGNVTQAQLFNAPDSPGTPYDCTPEPPGGPAGVCEMPQPDTTWFPVAGTQVTITVPSNTHAVVSVEPNRLHVIAKCMSGTVQSSLLVDGLPLGPSLYQPVAGSADFVLPPLVWTPTIGPGTHSVAIGLDCTGSSNSLDYYQDTGAPVRIERIKVP